MLGDNFNASGSFGNANLSAENNHSSRVLLTFIDGFISGFREFYFSNPLASRDENTISFHLVNYFNAVLEEEKGGFSPYKFSFVKNPPQQDSRKETDIGVVTINRNSPPSTIIEFEAKRLSRSSNNQEYVYGERGGIERFKMNKHGAHLTICGMFGYVQSDTSIYWIEKINSWIYEKSVKENEHWSQNEVLQKISRMSYTEKCFSKNDRKGNLKLDLYHYFIDLVG